MLCHGSNSTTGWDNTFLMSYGKFPRNQVPLWKVPDIRQLAYGDYPSSESPKWLQKITLVDLWLFSGLGDLESIPGAFHSGLLQFHLGKNDIFVHQHRIAVPRPSGFLSARMRTNVSACIVLGTPYETGRSCFTIRGAVSCSWDYTYLLQLKILRAAPFKYSHLTVRVQSILFYCSLRYIYNSRVSRYIYIVNLRKFYAMTVIFFLIVLKFW